MIQVCHDFVALELRTHEDVEELHAAVGWGCKCCGKLQSPSWYTCEGDVYCLGCKTHMARELRLTFTVFPTRAESGLPRTVKWTYEADSQGFEVAAHQRREHERIYGYC